MYSELRKTSGRLIFFDKRDLQGLTHLAGLKNNYMIVNFGNEVPLESVGMSQSGINALLRVIKLEAARGWHKAAQLVVLRRGQVVLDRSFGQDHRSRAINVETPFFTFSVTKAFIGMCVHRLIEEGKLEMDVPVAEYWPEFGRKGKEKVTLRQVFLHQAGVPMRGLYTQVPLWPFWGLVTRNVANLRAEFVPGSQTMYHLVNSGFILGEIVRRVSGLHIDEYLHNNFIEPLGLSHTWLRIPKRELKQSPKIISKTLRFLPISLIFNRAIMRRAVMPAASLHSTARDIAVFYQMLLNGGEYAGTRLIKPETIAAATELGSESPDALMGRVSRWSYGFHLGGLQPPPGGVGPSMGKRSTVRTFGHFGFASSMAWADPDAELVVVFICDGVLSLADGRKRWVALSDAVWDAVKD